LAEILHQQEAALVYVAVNQAVATYKSSLLA
jgi:hypothetical protein